MGASNSKKAIDTGGLLRLDGKDYALAHTVGIRYSGRFGGGNTMQAQIPVFPLKKLSESEYGTLAKLFTKRKFVNGELRTNVVLGSSADHISKLENVRIMELDSYDDDTVYMSVVVGKVTNKDFTAEEDWNSGVKK